MCQEYGRLGQNDMSRAIGRYSVLIASRCADWLFFASIILSPSPASFNAFVLHVGIYLERDKDQPQTATTQVVDQPALAPPSIADTHLRWDRRQLISSRIVTIRSLNLRDWRGQVKTENSHARPVYLFISYLVSVLQAQLSRPSWPGQDRFPFFASLCLL